MDTDIHTDIDVKLDIDFKRLEPGCMLMHAVFLLLCSEVGQRPCSNFLASVESRKMECRQVG